MWILESTKHADSIMSNEVIINFMSYNSINIRAQKINARLIRRKSQFSRKICFPTRIKLSAISMISVDGINTYFVINFEKSNVSNLLLIPRIPGISGNSQILDKNYFPFLKSWRYYFNIPKYWFYRFNLYQFLYHVNPADFTDA